MKNINFQPLSERQPPPEPQPNRVCKRSIVLPVFLLVIALGPLLFAAFLSLHLIVQERVAERIYLEDNRDRWTHAELKRENHAAYKSFRQNSATLMPAIQMCLLASGFLVVAGGGLWYHSRRTPKVRSPQPHPLDDPINDQPKQ